MLGAASISLLGAIRAPFLRLLATPENCWIAQAMYSVFGVALPEEAVKILVILLISARRRPFADPMDTVVYGAAAGLGFAAYENLAYLVQHQEMSARAGGTAQCVARTVPRRAWRHRWRLSRDRALRHRARCASTATAIGLAFRAGCWSC